MKNNITSLRASQIANSHPCLSATAHHRFSRIHVPVAPNCNVQCGYCIRKYDCVNESRPGVTSQILTPEEAIFRVRLLLEKESTLKVIGVAGPGDALANEETLRFFGMVRDEFDDIILCLSTNGLLLPEKIDEIAEAGVHSITITINTIRTETAEKIYSFATKAGKTFRGREAAELITESQKEGLSKAVEKGLLVKVNTVLIPEINDGEIEQIAQFVAQEGAYSQNIIGLIPQAAFSHLRKPGCHDIYLARSKAQQFMPQMSHCTKCRSDAFGKLGENRDIEYESISALLGLEYCESL